MIANILFCGAVAVVQSVLGASVPASGFLPAVSPLAFQDLEKAVGRTRSHGLSHEHLQSMYAHDSRHGLDVDQNALICCPYSMSADLRLTLESTFDSNHFHPVYFSKKEDRACFALSSYAETETETIRTSSSLHTLMSLSDEVTVTRIPHALKVDASVVDVANSLLDGERYSIELLFGLGIGGKGMHGKRSSAAVTSDVIAVGNSIFSSTQDNGQSNLMKSFFWSSREFDIDQTLAEHPLSKSFAKDGSRSSSFLQCSFDEMHTDLGRASVTLTAPRGTAPACMLRLAMAGALHRDVSLVLAHKGHTFASVAADPEPYEDATPATDQNAFVQSGNSDDTPYSDMGINGTSYVVGYIDSGADDLSCFLIDDSGTITPRTPHDDYANPITEPGRRKVIQYIAWADGSPAIGYDHGTWVTGSTAGKCIDDTSANDYNGVAPGAKVTMFDVDVAVDDNFVNVPSLYDICLPPAYGAGARIHSDSWGTPGMTSQTSKSLDVDQFTYENPDFLFIVAAANDGTDGYKSVGSPGVSKNALTIGATASNHDELVYFSSIGPTYDGSIKPDIVAPGQNLMSAGVRNLTAGQTDSCNVQLSSGTSMATPIAAGAAVLVREYLESPDYWGASCTSSYNSCPVVNPDKPGNFISGALLKATMVHSAEPISSYQSSDGSTIPAGNLTSPPPDVFQGWGQVLLKNLLPVEGIYDFNLYVADYQPLQSLQAMYFFVDVTDTSVPLRVTISWTDPANVVWAAKNLLNDLDLIIVSPKGYYYYGNNMKGDEHNPVERFVQAAGDDVETGVYTVIVVAKQLATESQDFGIVISCIGEVQEDRTFTAAADLSYELNYENATETCQGTYNAPTGNTFVRFQLEDWQSGASWVGLDFNVKDSEGEIVNTCTFSQNADASSASYTRSSQCTACLPDDATYTAELDTSKASADGSDLVRVASTQCDNVFLSSHQEEASFSLSGGVCNYCSSGYTRVVAFMKANVTDDDYLDYSWYGLAYWSMYTTSDLSVAVHSGTLSISDEEADRYCVPNGEYYVVLDDAALYAETHRHATVVFSSTTDTSSALTLSGSSGVLDGTIQLGAGAETWYEAGTVSASAGGSTGFGWSVSEYGGLYVVGAPTCVSPCTDGGTVSVYESTTLLQSIVSPDATITQEFGYSVSLSENYIVIGAPGDAMMGVDSGMIYIYQTGTLDEHFEAQFDASFMPGMDTAGARYGTSVAIYDGSDDVNVPENSLSEWVVVGAPGRNVTGMVSVYAKLNSDGADSWDLVGDLSPPLATDPAYFGHSVAWYNDFLAVSGFNNMTMVGFVAIYENAYPDTPDAVTILYAEDEVQYNQFGYSLSLFRAGAAANFGYVLGIGAPGVNRAYVFTYNPASNEWTENSRLIAPVYSAMDTDAQFGFCVSVNEDVVLVGSPGTGGGAGSAVTFLVLNQTDQNPRVHWSQQAVLVPSTSTKGDQFGYSASVNGPSTIIGAPGANGGAGSILAYIESISAAPTMAPTSSSKSSSSDDDEWSNLDSFNSLAILLVCMGGLTIIVLGAVFYMNFLAPQKGDMNEAFISNA